MTWQLAIVLFFVSTTIGGILRRKFSKTTNHDAGLISFVQHGGVILPLGILWSLTQSVHFSFSSAVHFWIFTLCAAIAGVVFNILSFKSQKTVDAGQFAIIGNLSTPLVVLLSVLLLHESLSGYQLLGMMCILGGASVVIGSPKNTKAALQKHVWYAVIAAVLTGVTIIVERYAIKASSVVVYILIGWLIQAVILAIFTRKKLHTARTISRSELLHIGMMGTARFGSFVMFLTAVKLSGNVSLMSTISSFRTVSICAASFVFLNERDRLWQKLLGAVVATLGLFLM